MSRFFGKTTASISPYQPGEQPQDRRYIKLNTNECPYPPSPQVQTALRNFSYSDLSRYPDPECVALCQAMADRCELPLSRVLAGGGSDELLGFAFQAFADAGDPVYFPDVTYGFYGVYAALFGQKKREIPLLEDFQVNISDYYDLDGTIFIANPNAPTGIPLQPEQIEEILKHNPHQVVVVDEAYADFAPGLSCMPLIDKYDNLLVIQTFSKSRSLAGMRLGFAFGQEELIDGLRRIKYSFNPYNIDQVSIAVGIASIGDEEYLNETVEKVCLTRDRTREAMLALGCDVLPSQTNFLLAGHPAVNGEALYQMLRDRGILARYFPKDRIRQFVRISIGTDEEMDACITALNEIIGEAKRNA